MSCEAKFTFLKGALLGREIVHNFDGSTTVAQVKKFLSESHQACDSSQSLVFVWDERSQKLNDDDQVLSSLGSNINITVNCVKNRQGLSASEPSAAARYARSMNAARMLKNEAFMRSVFDRHADSKGELSAHALMLALQEAGAPVLTADGSSQDNIFRRADANLSGAVDFAEWAPSALFLAKSTHATPRFMKAAQFPDELQMFLEDYDLQVFVAASGAFLLTFSSFLSRFLHQRFVPA
jgi:hypothetical protein